MRCLSSGSTQRGLGKLFMFLVMALVFTPCLSVAHWLLLHPGVFEEEMLPIIGPG
jgi:hypothetical protein